jgi:hypothetical protein
MGWSCRTDVSNLAYTSITVWLDMGTCCFCSCCEQHDCLPHLVAFLVLLSRSLLLLPLGWRPLWGRRLLLLPLLLWLLLMSLLPVLLVGKSLPRLVVCLGSSCWQHRGWWSGVTRSSACGSITEPWPSLPCCGTWLLRG